MTNLNRWAREFGYADFDTFLRTGGSIADAFRDIQRRIRELQDALTELGPSLQWVRQAPVKPSMALEPETIVADAKTAEDEPVDSENAQVQGDDHVV